MQLNSHQSSDVLSHLIGIILILTKSRVSKSQLFPVFIKELCKLVTEIQYMLNDIVEGWHVTEAMYPGCI